MALQDRAFFIRPQHPARQLLNAVAESGARWLDKDDIDPQMLGPLQAGGEPRRRELRRRHRGVRSQQPELQTQLQALARKAEMTERRHVEAARGKEKLEIAKHKAADTITAIVGEQRLPKFVRALLNQAWADVLTLTLLRQGEDSDEWLRQMEMTRAIVATCGRSGVSSDPALAQHVEAALGQVGYHAEEAGAIARRLTSAIEDDEDDPASRTELTMRLKARTRLGEDAVEEKQARTCRRAMPRSRRATTSCGSCLTAAGSNSPSTSRAIVVRRRLSWYSPVTDNALFVNQRGQRVGEQSLDSVARMLARGQARIVVAERARLVDRAWQATLNALRSFAGRGRAQGRQARCSCRHGGGM